MNPVMTSGRAEQTAAARDLLNACEREPIHVPGSVQPHGVLLCMDENLRIVQASESADVWLSHSADALVGRECADLLGESDMERLRTARGRADIEESPLYIGVLTANARRFDGVLHRNDQLLQLELEPTRRGQDMGFGGIYPLVRSFVSNLQSASSVDALCELAAQETKTITGFGRILVYRFDEDGHGQVLAERRDESYESYLGMLFPASDVPPQARELYLRNRVRLIADANASPSPLHPRDNPLSGAPTDLSFSGLRSVSPVHIQYMKNMGTLASMSVSIVVRGHLWGLISCHNAEPRQVPFDARTACEHLGQILSLQIEANEERAQTHQRLELRRILVGLLSAIADRDDFVAGLMSSPTDLLAFAGAGGAAILFGGRCELFGDTPDEAEVLKLVDWLSAHSSNTVFSSACIGRDLPADVVSMGDTAGVMAVSISQVHRNYIIWFRPEVRRTVIWAGRPDKTATTSEPTMLSPRHSFEAWSETHTGCSRPWSAGELDAALELRSAILTIVLRRAEEMAALAHELERSNRELEAFSYSVSHDLRAPLRHIVGYADLLRELEGEGLSDRGRTFLANVEESATFAGTLVDDLLTFSQMGRAALRPTQVNIRELAESVIKDLDAETAGRNVRWEFGELPVVRGDPAFLQMVMRNLLSNAVKYSRGREPAVIRIDGEDTATTHVVHVRDNGVGFNMKYVGKLFGVFQRLHRMEDFEGTGIGLANVRRIIERHDGHVWAEGETGHGAVFSFDLPKL